MDNVLLDVLSKIPLANGLVLQLPSCPGTESELMRKQETKHGPSLTLLTVTPCKEEAIRSTALSIETWSSNFSD